MPQAQTGSALVNLFPLVLIFVIFYFFLIRPQKLKEKEHQAMVAALTKNDDVITSGGIHGTILSLACQIKKGYNAYMNIPQGPILIVEDMPQIRQLL